MWGRKGLQKTKLPAKSPSRTFGTGLLGAVGPSGDGDNGLVKLFGAGGVAFHVPTHQRRLLFKNTLGQSFGSSLY